MEESIMVNYYINYNTGAGNKWVNGTLEEAMQEAENGLAYTQIGVTIEDENGKIVAYLPWYEVEPSEDDIVTCQFGSFGFYGEWILP